VKNQIFKPLSRKLINNRKAAGLLTYSFNFIAFPSAGGG